MLKEAKKWVQELEKTLTELSEEYGKSIEELDAEFEDFYDNGGDEYDCGSGGPYPNSIEAFRADYENREEEEDEQEAYDEVYKKMRAFAADRGYDLEDGEIESIIEEAEEDGDSVLDCADEALRELVEDWVADHQV